MKYSRTITHIVAPLIKIYFLPLQKIFIRH